MLLVFEEAHNYLPRKQIEGRKAFARHAVEKVAKEGRKYGVAAMIVSQRPSEISETVLSQCNSMVLMRMNNPDDQEYAARVVSDQFRSLINLLPSMKPGEGFIIGDAVLMPMRTLIDMPPKEPQSANMDFFGLWSSGGKGCDVERIVERWWRQERSTTVLPVEKTAPAPAQTPAIEPATGFIETPEDLQEAAATVVNKPKAAPEPEEPVSVKAAGSKLTPTNEPPSQPVAETSQPAAPDREDPHDVRSAAQKRLAELAAMLGGKLGT